jgi:hypothetical protein
MDLRVSVRIHVSQPSSPVSRGKVARCHRKPPQFAGVLRPFGTRDWDNFGFLPPGFRILSDQRFPGSESRSPHIRAQRSTARHRSEANSCLRVQTRAQADISRGFARRAHRASVSSFNRASYMHSTASREKYPRHPRFSRDRASTDHPLYL